jgi:Eukaryotic DNA topoisomerase I, catalytic core
VLATVVHLLESTLIRIGNDDYAKQNDSYGLTTLKNRHAAVDGNEVRFRFTGKSGKQWSLRVRDRRIAKIIRACQELPGQELMQYVDEQGNCRDVTSTDVNDYLREMLQAQLLAHRAKSNSAVPHCRDWRHVLLEQNSQPYRRRGYLHLLQLLRLFRGRDRPSHGLPLSLSLQQR